MRYKHSIGYQIVDALDKYFPLLLCLSIFFIAISVICYLSSWVIEDKLKVTPESKLLITLKEYQQKDRDSFTKLANEVLDENKKYIPRYINLMGSPIEVRK